MINLKGIDLFAGAGGFTLAAEDEGIEIVKAINHWDKAVQVHAANHPGTEHERKDLCKYNFRKLDPFDLLVAGPACQGHSPAGQTGRAHSQKVADDHKQLRATAWAVWACLKHCRPRFAVIENVPEFAKWAELEQWLFDLRTLGYVVTQQVLLASKFGIPQRRWRLFFICVLGGPAAHVENPDVLEPGVITIFDEDADGWIDIEDMRERPSKKGHKTAKEKARIADERLDGALGWGQHTNYGCWGIPASEPVNTLTTKAGQLWWTRDGQYRLWTRGERKQAMGLPADYDLLDATEAEAAKLCGNAVPPKMAGACIRAALRAAA